MCKQEKSVTGGVTGGWIMLDEEDLITQLTPELEKIMKMLGIDVDAEEYKETPTRFAKTLCELTAYVRNKQLDNMKTFPTNYTGIVLRAGIPFYCLCPHHLVPYYGTVDVAYIPHGRKLGISKIIRLVQTLSKQPIAQEELTEHITNTLCNILSYVEQQTPSVWVRIKAVHMCECMRGVKTPNVPTITADARGEFLDEDVEQKVLAMLGD